MWQIKGEAGLIKRLDEPDRRLGGIDMIRRMQQKDLDQVVLIEQSIFSLPWSRRGFEDSMRNPGNLYLVAEEQGEIQGYCGVWGIAGEGQICNVAVKQEARNQGIATAMLTELLKEGKEMGLNAFTLEVRVSNNAAIRVYQRLGFQGVGIQKNSYARPTEDALIMWRYE